MLNTLFRLRALAAGFAAAMPLLGILAFLTGGTAKASPAPEDMFGDAITSSFGSCYRIALGDLDGDGKVDLFGCTYANPSYDYFAYGDGAGNFNGLYAVGAPFDSVFQVALADLNNDGLPDPIQISATQFRLSVLLRQQDATYFPADPTEGIRFGGPKSFVVADFDHDGRPDVVVTCNDGTFFAKGGPNATFTVGEPFGPPNMLAMVAADFNGDGIPDLVTFSSGYGTLLWPGSPSGLGDPTSLSVNSSGMKTAGDFNGDGKQDIAGSGYDASSESYGIFVYLGDGAGGFSNAVFTRLGIYYFPSGLCRSLDIDGDGKDEFVQAGPLYRDLDSPAENGLRVFRSTGTGKVEIVYRNDDSLSDFGFSDVDGDGRPDLITVGSNAKFRYNRSQRLIFATIPDLNAGVGFPLQASASSGLPVRLEIVSGPGMISGGAFYGLAKGTVVIRASVEGNAIYQQVSKDQTITITSTDVPANAAGQFRFQAATATIDASKSTASFNVTRIGGTTGAVSVSYTTVDGTAHAGQDYTATTGTLTFADQQALATITVPLLSGAHNGATFSVQLSAPGGGAEIYAPGTLQVTLEVPSKPPVDPYDAYIKSTFARAAAYFAAGDTANGYFTYAAYRYYLYLQGGNRDNLKAYYQNLAYGYYIAYTKAGNPAAALAWYNYLTGLI